MTTLEGDGRVEKDVQSEKQQAVDENKTEIKVLNANIKLFEVSVRKSHDVSVALRKDLDLSLSDVECSIEKNGDISFLHAHRFIATMFCSAVSVGDVYENPGRNSSYVSKVSNL